jgi:transcriptional regulator with XRE-family HTH domain
MTVTTTTGGKATGTSAGGLSDYAPSTISQTRALSLDADYARTVHDMVGGDVRERQGEAREQYMADCTREKAAKSVAELLEELTAERGMGWSDIAEVLGVSISAIRKWRKGGDASPASRVKLARYAALLDVLEEKAPIADPAGWMELNLPLTPGYFIRPLDLYLDGHQDALMDLAERRLDDAAQVLDAVRPGWRDARSDFEVFLDVDGQRSVRRRRE